MHQGYRACLNARGISLDANGKLADVIGSCDQIVSDAQSDGEKAACMVGASIYRSLSSGKPTNLRFQSAETKK